MLSAHCANAEASVQWFWPNFCANPQRIPPIFHKSANLFDQTRQSDFPLWTPQKWEWDDQLLDYWWYRSKNQSKSHWLSVSTAVLPNNRDSILGHNSQNHSLKTKPYHQQNMSGNSKLMHFGILFNILYNHLILLQHVVFIIKYVLAIAIPDVPHRIRIAMRKVRIMPLAHYKLMVLVGK